MKTLALISAALLLGGTVRSQTVVSGGGHASASGSVVADGASGEIRITTTIVTNGAPHTVTIVTNFPGGGGVHVFSSSGGGGGGAACSVFAGTARPQGPVTWLGVGVDPVPDDVRAQVTVPERAGVIVRHVATNSPAAQAGVQINDILTKVDDQVLFNVDQLCSLIVTKKEGDTVRLTLLRKGRETQVTARLIKKVLTGADETFDLGGWNLHTLPGGSFSPLILKHQLYGTLSNAWKSSREQAEAARQQAIEALKKALEQQEKLAPATP